MTRPPLRRTAGDDGRTGRRWASLATGALLALTLVACSTTDDLTGSTDPTGSGYTSEDGSVRSWPAGDRSGPVQVAGTDYEGTAQDTADWAGGVVVLNTWYAACPPCRAEAEDLVGLATDYADQGVRVLGINGVDDAGAAQSFQRTFEVPYPSIDDRDKQAVAALQGVVPVQATPTTVVLDRDGMVAARIVGTADGSTLRALVDEVLAEGGGTADAAGPQATATAADGAAD